jgi:hypothetical protein
VGRLEEVEIIEEEDRVIWAPEEGVSIRLSQCIGSCAVGVISRRMHEVWSAKIPLMEHNS